MKLIFKSPREEVMRNNKFSHFCIITILGGIVFLIPLVVVVAILGKAFQFMLKIAEPVSKIIPIDNFAGFALVNVVAVLLILVICFFSGLVAESKLGKVLFTSIDNLLLLFIPGYSVMRDRMNTVLGNEEIAKELKPVIVKFDDQSQIAFEVERAEGQLVAVFIPGSPDPWSGGIAYVTADRVESLDIDRKAAIKICQKLGRGSIDAVAGKIDKVAFSV